MKITHKTLTAFMLALLLAAAVFAGCTDEGGNASLAESENEVSHNKDTSLPAEESEDTSSPEEESTEIYVPDVNEHGAFRISSIDDVSDEYKSIKRDELLEKLGDYEATYIYTGEYDDHGKVRTRY